MGPFVQTVVAPVAATAGVVVCGFSIGFPFSKSISVIILCYIIAPNIQVIFKGYLVFNF